MTLYSTPCPETFNPFQINQTLKTQIRGPEELYRRSSRNAGGLGTTALLVVLVEVEVVEVLVLLVVVVVVMVVVLWVVVSLVLVVMAVVERWC